MDTLVIGCREFNLLATEGPYFRLPRRGEVFNYIRRPADFSIVTFTVGSTSLELIQSKGQQIDMAIVFGEGGRLDFEGTVLGCTVYVDRTSVVCRIRGCPEMSDA